MTIEPDAASDVVSAGAAWRSPRISPGRVRVFLWARLSEMIRMPWKVLPGTVAQVASGA
jgi:hypothetical protein